MMLNERKNLHVALINTYSAHRRCCVQEFQKLNLSTGQPKVLSILYQEEGCLQKDLAMRCNVEPATMTSLLSNMKKKDLITKEAVYVSGGKRANAIYLTETGREMALKVNKIIDEMEEISFHDFTDDEKEQLICLLGRIQSNLDK